MATCRPCGATWTGLKPEHCPVCHETFTSTTAGDMHRVGKHGVKDGPNRRRCLTPLEMIDAGMGLSKRDMWKSSDDNTRFERATA